MQLSKIFSETTRPRAFTFGIQHYLEVLYQYLVDNTSGPFLHVSDLGPFGPSCSLYYCPLLFYLPYIINLVCAPPTTKAGLKSNTHQTTYMDGVQLRNVMVQSIYMYKHRTASILPKIPTVHSRGFHTSDRHRTDCLIFLNCPISMETVHHTMH